MKKLFAMLLVLALCMGMVTTANADSETLIPNITGIEITNTNSEQYDSSTNTFTVKADGSGDWPEIKITGENLQYLEEYTSDDSKWLIWLTPSFFVYPITGSFIVSDDGTSVTYALISSKSTYLNSTIFWTTTPYEIKYTNDQGNNYTQTGYYIVREKTAADIKVVIEMSEAWWDGWNGAAIQVFENGDLKGEATVTSGNKTATWECVYDPNAEYSFKWVKGSYDNECSFTITINDVPVVTADGGTCSAYTDGQMIYPIPRTYTVTTVASPNVGGTVAANPASAAEGATVTLTATPNDGYKFKEWQVVSGGVSVSENGMFTMPATNVEINAIFELEHICEPKETVAAKVATCSDTGNTLYYKCSCNKLYSDEACTIETTIDAVTVRIDKTAHSWKTPTYTKNGNTHTAHYVCSYNSQHTKSDPAVAHRYNASNTCVCGDVLETYSVTFNPNGGEGEMNDQTFTEGKAQALNANTFTRRNHFFTGWNTELDGTGKYFANKAEATFTENTTLYAQWSRVPSTTSYTVQYNANGGTGSVYLQAFTSTMTFELRMNEFVREGYKFVGWNTKADGTGDAYAEGASFSGSIKKSIVLYAQWKLDVPEFPAVKPEYKIEVDGQMGTITRTNDTSIIYKDMYIRWSIGFDTVDGPFAMIAMLDVVWEEGEEGVVGTFIIPVIETNGTISGVNYMLTTDPNANMIGVGEAAANMYGMLIK